MKKVVPIAAFLALCSVAWFYVSGTRSPESPAVEGHAIGSAPATAEPSTHGIDASAQRSESAAPLDAPASEALPAHTTRIAGVVLGLPAGGEASQGRPLPGVKVRLIATSTSWSDEPLLSETTSDGEGRFLIDLPHSTVRWPERGPEASDEANEPLSKSFRVVVEESEGYREGRTDFTVAEQAPERVEATLECYGHGDMTGRTLDVTGAPVEGVEVRLLANESELGRAVSDPQGRVVFERPFRPAQFVVQQPGTVVYAPLPPKLPKGMWGEARVVVASSAELSIVFEDEQGRGIPGLHVSLDPSAVERHGHERMLEPRPHGIAKTRKGTTDERGMVLFPQAWSGMHLRVSVIAQGATLWFERAQLERALWPGAAQSAAGERIVLKPSEKRALQAVLGAKHMLRGRVIGESGAGAKNVRVYLYSQEDPGFAASRALSLLQRTKEDGSFVFEYFAPLPLGQGIVLASDAVRGLGLDPNARISNTCSLPVDLDRPPEEELFLPLISSQQIHGRVVDAQGMPLHASIIARPRDGILPGETQQLELGYSSSYSDSSGEFKVLELREGFYDLEIRADGWARRDVPNVPAGTTGLTVSLTDPRPALLEVEVVCPASPVEWFFLLTAALDGPSRPGMVAPKLQAQETYSDPAGWPPEVSPDFQGANYSVSTWAGSALCTTTYVRGTTASIGLDRGLYWLGVLAVTPDRKRCFPVGTGLVSVESGKYKLRFEALPATVLEGRVNGPGTSSLWIGLFLPDGRPLPVDMRGIKSTHMTELGALGAFAFERVPATKFELRLGSEAEIAQGRARKRTLIDPPLAAPLVIDLE